MEKVKEPASLNEALIDLASKEAIKSKYDSIMKNDTCELDRNPKKKVIKTVWVWKI